MSPIKPVSQPTAPAAVGSTSGPSNKTTSGVGPAFDQVLDKKINNTEKTVKGADLKKAETALKFSNHAIERMNSRGIGMEGDLMTRLNKAVEKADAKGSKEALILSQDAAFIVNIKNKTVVTALDRDMMKENVFTNIDSTIVI